MALIHGKKIKLFTLNSNRELAQEIADHLGVELSACTVSKFADGEVNISINETVRGYTVFVVQPTNNPVNENYMELLVMIDALKRASAKEINVIMPYYGYSRQDRKAAPRQPISAKLMADLLQVAGADRMMCLDLHAAQIQGFFDIPIDNFLALPVLAEYFVEKNLEDIVVVSPDHGGTTRARKLAEVLDAPLAIVDKRRPKPNQAEVMNLIGEVEGKNCIIIDDMVDTAGTLSIVVSAIKARGAKAVYACCSHGLLSGPACERLDATPLEELVITNSVKLSDDKKEKYPWIKQLSIAGLLAAGILNIVDDKPVSDLFTYNKK
ncbi:MAG: ribose-phosphate pyrophosphokinase [Bacilli bacterium]|nr:ribose-phosphate pyrophosphokinase [Bacilli bacterium]